MTELLLDDDAIGVELSRVAREIAAAGVSGLVLLGVRRGGVPIAARLADRIAADTGTRPPVGTLDITLYRDDAATALPNPRIGPSEVPVDVAGRRLVIVDDVLFTGRTARAALDALLDYGRPAKIELAVLVDRGGRELPIQPDYVVHVTRVAPDRHVEVSSEDGRLRAYVVGGPTRADGGEEGGGEGGGGETTRIRPPGDPA